MMLSYRRYPYGISGKHKEKKENNKCFLINPIKFVQKFLIFT